MITVSLLTNNKSSWFLEYNQQFKSKLEGLGYGVNIYTDNEQLKQGGDICFFLACTKIVPKKYLQYHKHNLVIHHSDLPKGRGSSPLVWQIIEGRNKIVFTLFEAAEEIDTGDIYSQSILDLKGYELLSEIFLKRWNVEQKMILEFLEQYPNLSAKKQVGTSTFYRRRNFNDDTIDINKPLINYINNFRISDNEKWPLNFEYLNEKFYLKIYRENEDFIEESVPYTFKDIAIRPVGKSDLKVLEEIKNNESTFLNLGSVDISKNTQRNKKFVIFIQKTKEIIGVILIYDIDHINANCEIGIDIVKDYRGKGYGEKAYKMVLKYIFDHLNMHMVYLKVIENNEVAITMYEKIGFHTTGYFREFMYRNGRYWNYNVMCITKSEYHKAKGLN